MKRIIVVVLVILTGVSQSFSLSPTTVPNTPIDTHVGRLSFTPLIANPLEGRVGAMYQFADNKLRLDIGNSIDVYKLPNRDVAFGVDFYTFTRLRSEGNFKFPVETSDYYFGVNFSSSSLRDSKKYYDEESDRTYEVGFKPSLRLRLAHISSHLVDGLADTSGKLEKKPFVYSREFADLVFALENLNFRGYVGLTGIWATQPRDVNRFIPQLGLEYKYLLSNGIEAFAAYDFKLIGVEDTYVGTNAWQAGVKLYQFKERVNRHEVQDSPALTLNIYGYHGRSMHGMFYKERDSYIGTGFQFLF